MSPYTDNDPDVIEEMCIAAAELQCGDDDNQKGLSRRVLATTRLLVKKMLKVGLRRTGLMRMRQLAVANPSHERKSRRHL
jgi:hypothetical protein